MIPGKRISWTHLMAKHNANLQRVDELQERVDELKQQITNERFRTKQMTAKFYAADLCVSLMCDEFEDNPTWSDDRKINAALEHARKYSE